MNNWKAWLENLDIKPYSALGLFILLALPVTLILVFRSQDQRSSAATPDKLEAEGGTLSSTGVSKQTDTGASGGSYVLFNKLVASPTPSASPTNPPFGSRPPSGIIVRDGGNNVLIENIFIDGGSRDNVSGIGITINNVSGNIIIRNIDLSDLIGGIFINNCNGTLLIENVRSRNIGNGTIGSGHSNHIQLAASSFTGVIKNNKFLGGKTEDMLSTWHSGGKGVGQELIIENNQFQGLVTDTADSKAWSSSSGTGIIISDGSGSSNNGYIIVRNNTLLTVGQVGIQHIDGQGLQTYGNIVYGEKRAQNNNPITSWEGQPYGTVSNNKYCWINNDGSQPDPWFHSGSHLTVTNNVKDCTLNPDIYRININN